MQIFGPYVGSLDNAGEKLELSMPGTPVASTTTVPYIVVDRVHYANATPWPTSPNGTGPSLSRTSATAYANDVANWQASTANGGTPGASNGGGDTDAPTADVIDVTPDPRPNWVNTVTITFSEPVFNFSLADLTLTRDGGANLLTGDQTLGSSDNRPLGAVIERAGFRPLFG